MSQLSFPRINFKGLVTIDVGTCNNDDYSSVQFPKKSYWAGEPLRPMDSQYVQANYTSADKHGMTDEEWIKWCTTTQNFVDPPTKQNPSLFLIRRDESRASLRHNFNPLALRTAGPKKVKRIPAEWNYFGSMGMSMHQVSVTSSETAPNSWDDSLKGAALSYKNRVGSTGRHTALMNDVNPESVPCSQIFSDFLTLEKEGKAIMQGKPHKAVTRRINFQRNTNLNGPNGAGAYFQHAIPAEFLEGQPILDYIKQYANPDKQLKGVICRYYIARNLQPINTFQYPHNPDNGDPGDEWYEAIEALYTKPMGENKNAGLADLTGTIAPWYEGDMKTITIGRIMNSANGKSFDLPKGSVSNGPSFQLAPIVFDVDYDKGLVSLDCIDAFPDAFDVAANPGYDPLRMDTNPKYNLGTVTLVVNAPEGSDLKMDSYRFGTINYLSPDFAERGCLVDFSWDNLNEDLAHLIKTGDFSLLNDEGEALLLEEEYLIASDQNCIFAEQIPQRGATESSFINDTNRACPADASGIGIEPEHSTFRIFRKGVEITDPSDMPQLEIQVFDTTPNEDVADKPAVEHIPHPVPGQPITLGVDTPGNRMAYFAINGNTVSTYGDVNLMDQYYICVRILPNNVDYSQYYVDPNAKEKVGNDRLTFELMYELVLRYYYLMFPAMSEFVPLNQKNYWNTPDMARRLKARTSLDYWGCHAYMPRTRDLSQSRRDLLHAWCNKIIKNGPEPVTK